MKIILRPNTAQQDTRELTRSATIGAAPENDIVLDDPSVRPFHARLACEAEGWVLYDLAGGDRVLVDGLPVRRLRLTRGMTVQVGEVAVLILTNEDEPGAVPLVADMVPVTHVMQYAAPARHMAVAPYAEAGMPALSAQPHILPRLALITALCGPLLLGVGWLVGFIMAMLALLRMRHEDVARRERRIAWWAIAVSVLWVILLGALIAWAGWTAYVKLRIANNEAAASDRLRRIALTQFYVKDADMFDADNDETAEYVPLERLVAAGYHLLPSNLAAVVEYGGYYFTLLRADETAFACAATPLRYGLDGRRSFWVDERGLLYARDHNGAQLDKTAVSMLEPATHESLVVEMAEELAGDLARAAEQAYKKGDYARCKRIITTVRQSFPSSRATQRISALEQSADPFLAEFHARELLEHAEELLRQNLIDPALEILRTIPRQFASASSAPQAAALLAQHSDTRARQCIEQAEQLLKQGNPDQALLVLQDIVQRYPEAIAATTLKDRIAACEGEVLKTLDNAAAKLLADARAEEAAGNYENAYSIYLSVKNRYGQTTTASGIDEILAKNRRMIDELEASRLIDEILKLKPESEAARINALMDLLRRGYARTERFTKNEATLNTLQRTCNALQYVTAARDSLAQKSYRAALASLELALVEDPNVAVTMRQELEECYLRLGDAAFENQDFVQALDLYQQYTKLQPKVTQLNHAKLMHCYLQLAKMKYQKGDYGEAEKCLRACGERYGADAEYNFLYGCTLMNMKSWHEAVARFAAQTSTNSTHAREGRVYWAYCLYQQGSADEELLKSVLEYDADFGRLLQSYEIVFASNVRTGLFATASSVPPASTGTVLFMELTLEVCDYLEKLALETERLMQLEKEKTDERITQRNKVRALSQDLPNQLNVVRASASAEAYRKQKILERVRAVRKTFATLSSGLQYLAEKSHAPALIKFTNQMGDKAAALRKAEDALSLYVGLEEQRRRTVIAIIENLVSTIKPTFVNATVIKTRIDDLRNLYSSSRETELAVQALRAIAEAYAIVPAPALLTSSDTAVDGTPP